MTRAEKVDCAGLYDPLSFRTGVIVLVGISQMSDSGTSQCMVSHRSLDCIAT